MIGIGESVRIVFLPGVMVLGGGGLTFSGQVTQSTGENASNNGGPGVKITG